MFSSNSAKRCQHTRIHGESCGSPALKDERFCFFHERWREEHVNLHDKPSCAAALDLPVLEDAASIQVVLTQVMRLLLTDQIDSKKAGLLLYALQTASSNLSHLIVKPTKDEAKAKAEEKAEQKAG